jgi:Ca2+-binding RTX toxin-like protein
VLVNDTDVRALIAGFGGNDILVGGSNTDLLFGGAGVDALFGRGGNDYLFSDVDPVGTSYTDDGDLLNGGGGTNSAAQVGLDVIVRINGTLADGGGTKDVLTWLRARITKDPQALREEAFGVFGCPATYVPPVPVMAVTCSSCSGGGEPESPLLQNPANPLDVNADGKITPLDALLVINHLNQPKDGEAEASSTSPSTSFYGDVSGDRVISPIDVLLLINWLNSTRTAVETGEGEAAEVVGQSGILWVDVDRTNRGIPAVERDWANIGQATEAIAEPLGRSDEARWQLFARWGGQPGEQRDGTKANRPDLDVEEDLLALVARDVAGVGPVWNVSPE